MQFSPSSRNAHPREFHVIENKETLQNSGIATYQISLPAHMVVLNILAGIIRISYYMFEEWKTKKGHKEIQ